MKPDTYKFVNEIGVLIVQNVLKVSPENADYAEFLGNNEACHADCWYVYLTHSRFSE